MAGPAGRRIHLRLSPGLHPGHGPPGRLSPGPGVLRRLHAHRADLSTVFLPLTFVTGFFGQNFAWLVGHINTKVTFIIYGVGGLVLPLALLFMWLRMRRSGRAAEAVSQPART